MSAIHCTCMHTLQQSDTFILFSTVVFHLSVWFRVASINLSHPQYVLALTLQYAGWPSSVALRMVRSCGNRDAQTSAAGVRDAIHSAAPVLHWQPSLKGKHTSSHWSARAAPPRVPRLFLVFERGFKVYTLRPRVLRLLIGHHDENVSERFRSNNENGGKNYHTM